DADLRCPGLAVGEEGPGALRELGQIFGVVTQHVLRRDAGKQTGGEGWRNIAAGALQHAGGFIDASARRSLIVGLKRGHGSGPGRRWGRVSPIKGRPSRETIVKRRSDDTHNSVALRCKHLNPMANAAPQRVSPMPGTL